MMILATLESTEGYFQEGVFFENEKDFCEAVCDPCCVAVTDILRFCVVGDDYEERKDNLHELAVAYSNYDLSDVGLLDDQRMKDFFCKYGKRYGLLREFRENAIC